MPELPEVETMRRGILAIQGATIDSAQRTPCEKRPISIKPRIDHLQRRVIGKRIASIDRLGKRVVLATSLPRSVRFQFDQQSSMLMYE